MPVLRGEGCDHGAYHVRAGAVCRVLLELHSDEQLHAPGLPEMDGGVTWI
jgi:hypothetical protein